MDGARPSNQQLQAVGNESPGGVSSDPFPPESSESRSNSTSSSCIVRAERNSYVLRLDPIRRLDRDAECDSTISQSDSRSFSLARRANPKLSPSCVGSRTASTLSERFDRLEIDYKYRVHTKELGHLYGLCDAVPYLVGPRLYLRAINRFGVIPVPVEAYQDRDGKMVLDPQKLSTLDKVLLAMLYILSEPHDRRPPEAASWFAGMSLEENRLVVYKDIGFGREPKKTAMHRYDFLDLAFAWERLPNPALVAEDLPDAVTPWHTVADKLRADGISLRDIDKALYIEFVQMNEDELDARVTRLSTTNELALRKRQLADRARKPSIPASCAYIMPQQTNPDVMYAKRFDRQHPQGYLLDTTVGTPESSDFADVKPDQPEAVQEETAARLVEAETNYMKHKVSREIQRVCLWLLAFMTLIGALVGIALMIHFKKGSVS